MGEESEKYEVVVEDSEENDTGWYQPEEDEQEELWND